ncbi:MAG: DUF1810 domain-containing protein [Janthinobacterium lividum]
MRNVGLEKFVEAQDGGGTYAQALRELRGGRKTSHWMWFVFPQVGGLGHSSMAQAYAIDSLQQARDYLVHPVLGPRFRECTAALLAHTDRSAEQIMGGIDALKLRSSMTLFARADPGDPAYQAVLDAFYGGEPDARTDSLLGR